MPAEIERKFLIDRQRWPEPKTGEHIQQAYLSSQKERVIRLRIAGEVAHLTVKGITTGATRLEFEYEIPVSDARQMISEICEQPVLEKVRYRIPAGRHVWEVDEFLGANEGLLVAEIELEDEAEEFEKPDWIAAEVTDDPRYFNSNLLSHPYSKWSANL